MAMDPYLERSVYEKVCAEPRAGLLFSVARLGKKPYAVKNLPDPVY